MKKGIHNYNKKQMEETYETVTNEIRSSAAFVVIVVGQDGRLNFVSYNLTPENSLEILESVQDTIVEYQDGEDYNDLDEDDPGFEAQASDTESVDFSELSADEQEEIQKAEELYQKSDEMLEKATYVPLRNTVH